VSNYYEFIKSMMYATIIGSNILAAYLIAKQLKVPLLQSGTVIKRIKAQNLKIQQALVSQSLEEKFEAAGFPFRLNAKRFQFIRYGLGILFFVVGVYFFVQRSDVSIVIRVLILGLPILITFDTLNPNRKMMRLIFRAFQDRQEYLKNQEFFMIYSMIVDEMKETSRVSVIHALQKLRQYAPKIRGSINKGLRNASLGIDTVMTTIGEDIGTEEAIEVSKILANLESSSPENLHELIASKEESYVAKLRANRTERRDRTTNIVNVIVWLPFLLYVLNYFFLLGQLLNEMTSNVHNFK
jgi:hypothetical protein